MAAASVMAATSLRCRPLAAAVRSAPSGRPRRARACRGARHPCACLLCAVLGLAWPPLASGLRLRLRGARSAAGVWSSLPTITLAPSDRLAKPVVTTRSEVESPLAITASFSFCWVTTTGLAVDDIVGADHVAERPRRTALHGGGRHHDRLRQCLDLQAHIDELSGPELELVVGKFGLELQRAGGGIDLVVDAFQRAGIDHGRRHHCRTHRRPARPWRGRIDPHDLLLRQAELHRDRLQLGDDDEAGGIGRMDDVALVDLAQAGAARSGAMILV